MASTLLSISTRLWLKRKLSVPCCTLPFSIFVLGGLAVVKVKRGYESFDLFVVHFVAAPITWLSLDWLYLGAFRGEDAALARSDLDQLTGRHVVVLASTDPMFAVYASSRLLVEGRASPASWHALSFAPVDHRVRRVSASAFELEQLAEPPPNFEQAFRAESTPYRPGERAELGLMRATVLEGQGRWRKRVRFEFPGGLEASNLVFLAWKGGALRRVSLPGVGQTLLLPRENGPWNLL